MEDLVKFLNYRISALTVEVSELLEDIVYATSKECTQEERNAIHEKYKDVIMDKKYQ